MTTPERSFFSHAWWKTPSASARCVCAGLLLEMQRVIGWRMGSHARLHGGNRDELHRMASSMSKALTVPRMRCPRRVSSCSRVWATTCPSSCGRSSSERSSPMPNPPNSAPRLMVDGQRTYVANQSIRGQMQAAPRWTRHSRIRRWRPTADRLRAASERPALCFRHRRGTGAADAGTSSACGRPPSATSCAGLPADVVVAHSAAGCVARGTDRFRRRDSAV